MKMNAFAQCNSAINSFPYKEGFESGKGGWFAGGIASDWAFGSPSKNVIKAAANGNNCWITGGLTGNYYNDGERSWLQSPCFDFSTLKNPIISFNIFWDTENNYDGAGFQYSVDGGASWLVVGKVRDACPNSSWYNNGVNFLSDFGEVQGWSGSAGNGGSGAWVQAAHLLPELGGKVQVMFRFVFGAGTKYNNFNGFAVDDISISELQPSNASFTYSCVNASTVNFQSTNTCNANIIWDFDDLSSGTNNTSNQSNTTHIFSKPGLYNVKLTLNSADGNTSTISQDVNIISLTTSVAAPVKCAGNSNGSLLVQVNGNNANYNFLWNTNPAQTTMLANNLPAGNYTVTVSEKNTCTDTSNITLAAPQPINVFLGNDTSLCPGNFITLMPGNYNSYVWQDNSTTSTYTVNNDGIYYVKVTNADGCKASDTIKIIEDCGNVFFPSAFTPNGDGVNDSYGPSGNLSLLKDYRLNIYNRWGAVVFTSNNPYAKWKGNAQILQATVYTYYAKYMYNGKAKSQQGTITIIF